MGAVIALSLTFQLSDQNPFNPYEKNPTMLDYQDVLRFPNRVRVSPRQIFYKSVVGGARKSVIKLAAAGGYTLRGDTLDGDWDIESARIPIHLTPAQRDFSEYLEGNPTEYNWHELMLSLKKHGWIDDTTQRAPEVAIGRFGDLHLVDGRHRVIAAQHLDLPHIWVDIVFIHPYFNFRDFFVESAIFPKILWNGISAFFNDESPYQSFESEVERLTAIKSHLEFFRGSSVLDIGCNAGIQTWSLAQTAKSYIGIEPSSRYFGQNIIVLSHLRELFSHVSFRSYNLSLKGALDTRLSDFDTLYLSFVLYWLSDIEINILRDFYFPRCNKVFIINRNKERSAEKNSFKLNADENVLALLTSAGYRVQHFHSPLRKTESNPILGLSYVGGFSVFLAERVSS